jgi:hypothetical protein
MCDDHLTRRSVVLGLGAAAVLRPRRSTKRLRAVPVAPGLDIVPRAEWGGDLVPTGPVPDEPDVRFLLVHHSVNANDYAAADVPTLLADIFRFHTSADRGWPDIAYNFFVDRFGGVWEGRTGSLDGAKAADATGGSQGFAQLCCLLGDHRTEPASEAALSSLVATLAWLGGRYGLDLTPGATATFTSRGSNRHPAGAEVTTATISGHRDMSTTACPGDAVYSLIADGTLARLVTDHGSPTSTTTTAPTSTTSTATTAATIPTPTTAAPATTAPPLVAAPPAAPTTSADGPGSAIAFGVAATAAAAVLAGLVAVRRRRR